MAATDLRESEWQFDAIDLRPVLRRLEAPSDGGPPVAATGSASHVDLYLDTDDRRFHRAGYSLRIRRSGRRKGGEATLKALGSAREADGLRVRRELSESIGPADAETLARAPGPVGERVRAVAGARAIEPLFEVRTRRRTFSLGVDPPAELALDETSINLPSGGSPARLRRVEVEIPERAAEAFAPYVHELRDTCGLRPAELSKYEAGLLAAGLGTPEPEPFGTTEIDPDGSIGAAARAVLRRHFGVFVAMEPGTRLGDDIEDLHDMRVASRRLRAALSLFADVLPATSMMLREELSWIGGELGAVRDLDVQLEQLEPWVAAVAEPDREPLDELRGLLERQRATARAEMLAALDSRRYRMLVERFGRMLRGRTPRSGPSAAPVREVGPELIKRRFRPFRKAADRIRPETKPSDYHSLRIRCKRLRYTLEFLADVYPEQTRPVIKRLVALQDILGLHQDADVAVDRLRRLAVESGEELSPAAIFAMGEIAERYRQSMAGLRTRFPPAYARVKGKSWRALERELNARRPAPPEPALDAG